MKKIPQDIVGTIAILKFKRTTPWLIKKIRAILFLRNHKNITTVLEKTEKISGVLRKQKTKYLAGIKTKETIYKENNCIFKYNIDETYFSPRLSNERKIIAQEVLKEIKKKFKGLKEEDVSDNKKNIDKNSPDNLLISNAEHSLKGREGKNFDKNFGDKANYHLPKILVMFAGIAPYPIVIAKILKQNKTPTKIYSNELNHEANLYAKENIKLNKLENYITILEGDANKIKTKDKFDIILMPRPNLEETFLTSALKLSKKGTKIFYHGFGTKEEVLSEIKRDTKSKIKNLKIRKAGDIAPNKFRWNAEFEVK